MYANVYPRNCQLIYIAENITADRESELSE